MTAKSAVSVRNLTVQYTNRGPGRRASIITAVHDVSFDIMPGETLALVGESGSGKSTTARAILGLLARQGGTVQVNGHDLSADAKVPRWQRWDMQIVFQDPYSSLDPAMRVLDIVAEPLDSRRRLDRAERRRRVADALEHVSLSPDMIDRYPDQFSGGQRQRIAIARAIVGRPTLVVCDEAVSALDVSTQGQILNLLKSLQLELGVSYLFITHDLGVVRAVSHRTAVMYLGEIVEEGPTERIWTQPAHPYSAALLAAIPGHRATADPSGRLALPGEMPSPAAPPPGCRFHPRCPVAMDVCRTEMPPVFPVSGGGMSACHLHATGRIPPSGSVLPEIVDRTSARSEAGA
jgi:oligopeptide/dipeptide ABC transporter ATP-binding protein